MAIRRCTSDAECVLARDACDEEVGVRGDRIQDFVQRVAQERVNARCGDLGAFHTGGFEDERAAFCSDGYCQAASPSERCVTTEDCVVVGGSCGMVAIVNRESEESVRTAFERRASVGTCAGDSHAPPLIPYCRGVTCVGQELDLAELRRGCRNDRQCVVLAGVCGAPMVVSRRHRRAAQQEIRARRAGVDCGGRDPRRGVEAACINDYCVPMRRRRHPQERPKPP